LLKTVSSADKVVLDLLKSE